jgi:hypothetical protein
MGIRPKIVNKLNKGILITMAVLWQFCSHKQPFVCENKSVILDESGVLIKGIVNLTHWHKNKYLIATELFAGSLDLTNGKIKKLGFIEDKEFNETLDHKIRERYYWVEFMNEEDRENNIKQGNPKHQFARLMPTVNNDVLLALYSFQPFVLRNPKGEINSHVLTYAILFILCDKELNFKKIVDFSLQNNMGFDKPDNFKKNPFYPETGEYVYVSNDSIQLLNMPYGQDSNIPIFSNYRISADTLEWVSDSEIMYSKPSESTGLKKKSLRVKRKHNTILYHNFIYDLSTHDKLILGNLCDSFWIEDICKKDNYYYILAFKRIVEDNIHKAYLFKISKGQSDKNGKTLVSKRLVGNFEKLKRGALSEFGYTIIYENEKEDICLLQHCFD